VNVISAFSACGSYFNIACTSAHDVTFHTFFSLRLPLQRTTVAMGTYKSSARTEQSIGLGTGVERGDTHVIMRIRAEFLLYIGDPLAAPFIIRSNVFQELFGGPVVVVLRERLFLRSGVIAGHAHRTRCLAALCV
jgi:hypothetical protein